MSVSHVSEMSRTDARTRRPSARRPSVFRSDLMRPVHELLTGHAESRPEQIAFADAHRSVTYAELAGRTARLAGHLAELGLERGARAVIYLTNRVETVESYLAITRAAAIGVPFNPQSSDSELAYLLDDCAASMLITGTAQLPQVRRVLADRPGIGVVVVSDPATAESGADDGLPHYESLATTWSIRHPPRDDLGMDEPAWMLYTSGTTGSPKGVVSTQRSSLWATGACTAPVLGLSPQDRVLWPMPLFHAVAHNVGVLGVVAVGATARITDGLAADDILRTARKERSTFLVGVPTMYHHMVELARSGAFGIPAGLRVCMVAGSSCPVPLHEGFRAAFGIALLDSYGSTETGGAITTNLPEGPYVPGSCGLPVPGLRLRLTDPRTGAEVPEGAEGEIRVSSPALMRGYHRREEATAEVLADGWYRTGDIGRLDEAGYLTITGRVKELIIRGGENIHPGEIEKVLLRVDGIADAAVGAQPHEALGEVPVAYLVPRPGSGGIDVEAVLAMCRAELSSYKLPEELHEIDEVPRNAAGKIARKRLGSLRSRLLWRKAQESARTTRSYEGALELGLLDGTHPLLQATVELPGEGDGDGVLFSGRLPGLAALADTDARVLSRTMAGVPVVLPSVLAELALHAGDHVGCGRLLELTTTEPLVVPEQDGAQLRVTVGAPGADDGVRTVTVHARRDGLGAAGRPWTCHATGALSPGTAAPPPPDLAVWPPAGAERVPAAELGAADGLPRELRSIWRRDGELFAEVALVDGNREQGALFGLHPALLDAALSPALLHTPVDPVEAVVPVVDDGLWWPQSWHGVTLYASGASVLRVRVRPRPDGGFGIEAADAAGDPVLAAESVTSGRTTAAALARASAVQQDGLFAQVWDDRVLAARGAGSSGERWAVVGDDPLRARSGLMAAGRYAETYPDLGALARAVEEGTAATPDVVVVMCADRSDPVAEAVRGAVREGLEWARHWADPLFAEARLVVLTRNAVPAWGLSADLDLDLAGAAVWGLIGAAQDRAPGRFVLVDTDASKRAWRVLPDALTSGEPRLALRGRAARVPRTERVTPGAGATAPAGPLPAMGAADAEPDSVQGTPPSAVLFATAVDPAADEDVDVVLRPVVDAALTLLPAEAGELVITSPAPSPAPGLVSEAAAAFLDAWATRLHAAGVPAVSIRTADLLNSREARDLFDVARTLGLPAVLAARTDLSGEAAMGPLSGSAALRRGLVRGTPRRVARDELADPSGLRHRLAALSDAEQEEAVLDLVRAQFATALGLPGGDRIPPDGETRDLNFDSLTALTARNALVAATGLPLPAAVVFDYATPAALARHMKKQLLAR
ncbi:AMP-binding protein [Streptomyces sp. YIM S03343]